MLSRHSVSNHAKTLRRHRGSILQVAGVGLGLLILAGSSAMLSANYHGWSLPVPWASYFTDAAPLTNGELAVALTQVALDPDAAAAAGMLNTAMAPMVSAVRTHLEGVIQDHRDADLLVAEKRELVDSLTALIQAGGGDESTVAQLSTATTELAGAITERAELRNAVLEAAALGGNSLTTVQAIAAARAAHWDVPAYYQVESREQVDWVNLRNALANAKINGKAGQPPSQIAAQIIDAENAKPDVAAAKAAYTTNLASVKAAWNLAVYPQ